MEDKITECWLVNEESIFFLICHKLCNQFLNKMFSKHSKPKRTKKMIFQKLSKTFSTLFIVKTFFIVKTILLLKLFYGNIYRSFTVYK